MKVRVFPEHNYKAFYFNDKTVRIALDASKPIPELKHPEFYDVKITDRCYGKCPYCYMNSSPDGDLYNGLIGKINDFFGSMSENEKPFQVAIGGGEPTCCPEFLDILQVFHELGITPNYTTNGMWIEDESYVASAIMRYTKNYCGGVAISCHPHLINYWENAALLYIKEKIKLSFHIVISDEYSCNYFKNIYEIWKKYVDYFVLLPYSDQGRGDFKEIDWEYLLKVMPEDTSKIAFGANFYSYLLKSPGVFNVSLYEPESMSKFLDLKDMKVYPSSFHLDG